MDDQTDQRRKSVTKLELGEGLRRLRRSLKLTQVDVSRRAQESGSRLAAEQISKWENGHDWPTLRSLFNFLAATERDLGDLQRALDGAEAAELTEKGVSTARLGDSSELRALAEKLIGESAEIERLRDRISDLERKARRAEGRTSRIYRG